MNVQTTLNFFGRTEEALKFYQHTIDAEVLFLMRFRECPDKSAIQPGTEDKIFHATFRVGSTTLMASDAGCFDGQAETSFDGFSLAIRLDSPKDAERIFKALCDGGKIVLPMASTFFAPRYGIVTDKFGLSWKVIADSKSD